MRDIRWSVMVQNSRVELVEGAKCEGSNFQQLELAIFWILQLRHADFNLLNSNLHTIREKNTAIVVLAHDLRH